MSTVTAIPVWKRDATAEERFLELAQLARENPERFEKVLVGWIGVKNGKPGVSTYVTTGCNALDALGMATLTRRNVENWNMSGGG